MKCVNMDSKSCRSYLLVCEETREAAIVDPLLEIVESYLDIIKKENLKLKYAIDTHTHADHVSGATSLKERAPYVMHANTKVSSVTRKVSDGETVGIGKFKITFLHTPGHTMDSMSLVAGDRLLSGDFLFSGPDGAGRLDFPGSDPSTHFDSLRKLDGLSGDLLLFPAHEYAGQRGATLAEERAKNPVLSPRSREAYVNWWQKRRRDPEKWMEHVVAANVAGCVDPKAVAIPMGGGACACAAPSTLSHSDLPQISPANLAKKLRLDPRSVSLLDVRTPEEFNDELGHIAGAVLIPVDELQQRLDETPKDPVAVICRSGKRATRAAVLLRESGRDKVWVMTGGMLAWNEAGLPKE